MLKAECHSPFRVAVFESIRAGPKSNDIGSRSSPLETAVAWPGQFVIQAALRDSLLSGLLVVFAIGIFCTLHCSESCKQSPEADPGAGEKEPKANGRTPMQTRQVHVFSFLLTFPAA